MRCYYNVSREQQIRLEHEFQGLLDVAYGDSEAGYSRTAISVFDHWLDEEEARVALNSVPAQEQERRDSHHNLLNMKLVLEMNAITFRIRGRGRKAKVVFKRFASVEAAREYIKPSRRPSFVLVLPEIGGVYYEGWDDTNILYLRDDRSIDRIVPWLKECGLHALP